MKRVQENGTWTLMCPNECPGLYDVHGEEFEKMYTDYEQAGKGRKTIKAHELWEKILAPAGIELVYAPFETEKLQKILHTSGNNLAKVSEMFKSYVNRLKLLKLN